MLGNSQIYSIEDLGAVCQFLIKCFWPMFIAMSMWSFEHHIFPSCVWSCYLHDLPIILTGFSDRDPTQQRFFVLQMKTRYFNRIQCYMYASWEAWRNTTFQQDLSPPKSVIANPSHVSSLRQNRREIVQPEQLWGKDCESQLQFASDATCNM